MPPAFGVATGMLSALIAPPSNVTQGEPLLLDGEADEGEAELGLGLLEPDDSLLLGDDSRDDSLLLGPEEPDDSELLGLLGLLGLPDELLVQHKRPNATASHHSLSANRSA